VVSGQWSVVSGFYVCDSAAITDLALLRFLESSDLFENSNSAQWHDPHDCHATTKNFSPLTKTDASIRQSIFECDEHVDNLFAFAEALPVKPEPIAAKVSNPLLVDDENQHLPIATFLHSSEDLSLLNLQVQPQDAPEIVAERSHERHCTTNPMKKKKEWNTERKAPTKQPKKIGRNAKKRDFTKNIRVCKNTGGYEIQVRRQNTLQQQELQFIPLGPHDVVKGQSPLLRNVSGNKHLRSEVEHRYENEYLPASSKKMKTGLYEGIRDDLIAKGGRFWKQKQGETWWTEIKAVNDNMSELREIVATKFKDENKKKQREQDKHPGSDEHTSPLKTTKDHLEKKAEKNPGGCDAH